MSQSTLSLGQAPSKHSLWVKELCDSGYFSFVDKAKNQKGRAIYSLRCLLCSPIPIIPTDNTTNTEITAVPGPTPKLIQRTDSFNFIRHLEVNNTFNNHDCLK
jgi:hypothetical protein